MNCCDVEEEVLGSFEKAPSASMRASLDAHLATCEACARFARVQHALDLRLGATLVPPAVSSDFRPALRQRIRLEATSSRRDSLPDVLHFASCGVATVVSAVLLPLSPLVIVAAGTTTALATYVLLSAIRSSFEDDLFEADV